MSEKLYQQIENDIRWTRDFEKELEKHTKESINKLKERGKLSDAELKTVYNTNYKKLFSWQINSLPILTKKIWELNSLTDKLIATYLKKQLDKKNETPIYKKAIYWACRIDTDLTKNSTVKNIAKGVIDEILAIPEMLAELIKHPIDTWKALYNALVKNFSWTMQEIVKQYWNIFSGLSTPKSQYDTGRSAALIILTFLPGGAAKWLGKIWSLAKNTLKATWKGLKGVGKAIVKWEVKTTLKETGKKVLWKSKETLKKGKDSIKNTLQKGAEMLKKPFKNWAERIQNKSLRSNLKTMEKQLDDLKKSATPDTKAIKELEKQIRKQKNAINKSNTRLWLDNNKISRQKQGLERIKKNNESLKKNQELLKAEKSKVNPDPKTIQKIEKDIAKLNTKIKEATKKWKNYDVRKNTTPTLAMKVKVLPSLLKKGFSKEGLMNVLKSPQRLPFIQSIQKLKKAKLEIKRMKQQIESINAKLNTKWKNGKTAYENAIVSKTPNFPPHKRVLDLIRQKASIQKEIERSASIWNKALWETIARGALGFWIINKLNQEAVNNILKEETLHELLTYLGKDNDQYYEESDIISWLASWNTDINLDNAEIESLNNLTAEELKNVKLTITGKASKTGSESINTRLATERANIMKTKLLEKYPALNPNNIKITTKLQPQDNNEDLGRWQGAEVKISSLNPTYLEDYTNIQQEYTN